MNKKTCINSSRNFFYSLLFSIIIFLTLKHSLWCARAHSRLVIFYVPCYQFFFFLWSWYELRKVQIIALIRLVFFLHKKIHKYTQHEKVVITFSIVKKKNTHKNNCVWISPKSTISIIFIWHLFHKLCVKNWKLVVIGKDDILFYNFLCKRSS